MKRPITIVAGQDLNVEVLYNRHNGRGWHYFQVGDHSIRNLTKPEANNELRMMRMYRKDVRAFRMDRIRDL